ncbi:MAG TPA: hypothetical protein VN696_08515 [Pyrinomonadaceae bacterium]|nr:hypothetical protein [Pyrinomonadaceae bacterium]
MGIRYAGVWRAGSGQQLLSLDWDWNAFQNKWQNLSNQNMRLVDFTTYVNANQRLFSGVYRPGTDAHYLWVGADWNSFQTKWSELSNQGLRLTNLQTWLDGNTRKYAGVWRQGTDAHYLWVGVDWASFHAKWQELSNHGLRLVDFQTYVDGTVRHFAGVWRAGNDAHYLWVGADWTGFKAKWQELAAQGLRLTRFRRYVDGGVEHFAGVWRQGTDGYYLWVGVDRENIRSKNHELEHIGLRLCDVEAYDWGCSDDCANQVVARNVDGKATPYVYGISGDNVAYRWPVDNDEYARLSAITFNDKLFTLPFDDPKVVHWGTWEYSPHSYHHAIDYLRDSDWKTFKVRAAAPGKVIFVGWDTWSGNTIVVSHDSNGVADAFRTIYMHLRNGADHDANAAWNNTIPTLGGNDLVNYTNYLNTTGATQNVNQRNLNQDYWGTNAQAISPALLGSHVVRGQMLAWAGCTGPGGCGYSAPQRPNTHLHIFFCRRDPTDNNWYFIDPYGIYAHPGCYPGPVTDMATGPCVRYGVAWEDGRPQYP